jgi:peptide/nickel transport system ATP-binding protein
MSLPTPTSGRAREGENFLEVRNLQVEFPTEDGIVRAVAGVSFAVNRGETLAIVGESGSGKSVTSQAIMGLITGSKTKIAGEVFLAGEQLIGLPADEMRAYRGKRIAMVFQDPLSSLHPFYRISKQLIEAILVHTDISKQAARAHALELLTRVGIPNAQERMDDYPHQLSGGMRQRVMIAMALVNAPELLIADEPTTALDVTVQAQILELLRDLQKEFGMAIILITHDLGVVAEVADRVAVMYAGRIVEYGTVDDIFYRPQMPYTMGLLGSITRMDVERGGRLDPIPGQPPSLISLPSGCTFNPRCPYSHLVPDNRCTTEQPELLDYEPSHGSRCHLTLAQKHVFAREVIEGKALT